MTYADKDATVDDGAPINVYQFNVDGIDYYRTDDARPITINGHVFEPQQIERSALASSINLEDRSRFTITFPTTDPLAAVLTGLIAPLAVQVWAWEVHLTDPDQEPKQFYSGVVSDVSVSEAELVTLTFTPVTLSFVNAALPWPMYSRNCNHTFGDGRCGYNLEATAHTGPVVVGINLWTLEISAPVPGESEYDGGTVENLRTGAKQQIVNLDGVLLFTLGGFVNVQIGDALKFYKGCDKRIEGDCAKYGNQARFGGFPHVPDKNPFLKGFGDFNYGGSEAY